MKKLNIVQILQMDTKSEYLNDALRQGLSLLKQNEFLKFCGKNIEKWNNALVPVLDTDVKSFDFRCAIAVLVADIKNYQRKHPVSNNTGMVRFIDRFNLKKLSHLGSADER